QGEIMAGAIAASATVETNAITIDPDRLLELHNGESYGPTDEALSWLEFPINPERVAPVLRRLVEPTKTRARIYDRDGVLLLDSRNLYGRGDVLRFELAPPNVEPPGVLERTWIAIKTWLGRGDLPLFKELGPENGRGYPEVIQGLAGPAEGVRRRVRTRVEIPDFTDRRDEIGHLSGALRDMTNSLYRRIEAIESFSADVSHELKNPLTSLRSAVETLPLAKTDES